MDTTIDLTLPVREVTLLEDRAQVTRLGSIELPAGSHRLRVPDVTPLAVDRSLLPKASVGRVDDVRVVRSRRVGAIERPERLRELAVERDALVIAESRAQAEQTRLHGVRDRAQRVVGLLLQAIQRELPWAEAPRPEDGPRLAEAFAEVRRLDVAIAAAEEALRQATMKKQVAERNLRERAPSDGGMTAELLVFVTLEQPAKVELSIGYLVPCALWRPAHRATLRGARLQFECEAAVWQATGEDWTDVQLCCSTARPAQLAEPPLLSDEWLEVKRREEKKIEIAIREQKIESTGEGAAPDAELPGVDDGGETRLLCAPTPCSIASDGRLRRVPLFSFEADADVRRIARPERGQLVHLQARLPNASQSPILAGPVELVREAGAAGRAEVGFVAAGEKFLLGFGGDGALRVHRSVKEKTETATLTGKRTIDRTVEVKLSNLDATAVKFRVEERVPVSELEAVTVKVLDATSPPAQPDPDGIVGWEVELPAHGHRTLQLAYRLVATSDVKGAL